jgi:hypothetical protein
MNPRRSSNDVINSFIDQIRATDLNISTQVGEEVQGVLLAPVATETERAYVLLQYYESIPSLSGIEDLLSSPDFLQTVADALGTNSATHSVYTINDVKGLIGNDLDALVNNWNVARKTGSTATVIVRFCRPDNSKTSIPDQTAVRTSGENMVEFKTIGALNNQPSSFDQVRGLYYVEVPAQCTVTGKSGNVSPGSINTISPSISGVTSVYNPYGATGGTDPESDTELIARAKIAWMGRNLGTVYGYEKLLEEQPSVIRAMVVGPNDEGMTRYPVGAVDIYVIGAEDLVQVTQVFAYVSGITNYALAYQPVTSIISVVGSLSGAQAGCVLVKDPGAFGNSVQGNDYLDVSSADPGFNPAGENVTVVYYYDKNVKTLQDLLDSDENKLVDSDILLKDAYKSLLNFAMEVVPTVGFTETQIQSVIADDLEIFFNGGTASNNEVYEVKNVGDDVDLSDLVKVIVSGEIDGVNCVDRLINSSFLVTKTTYRPGGSGGTFTASDDFVTIDQIEFARLGEITWL